MGKLTLFVLVLCSVVLSAAMCWADTIPSCLGHQGPAFARGTMPSTLGWGPDDKPYPDKFVVNPGDGSEMVWVPAGEFMMGSPEGEGDPNEHPQHKVQITKGFWLGRGPVTNGQYRAFCQATGRAFPEDSKGGPNQPVVCLTWEDARAYCRQYRLALPREAQWEYAARGPQSLRYPWGNDWDPKKCCNPDNKGAGPVGTLEVGSLPAGDSWCGASDMAGNVWDWCADWYDEGYYAKSPAADPRGPADGNYRLLRGGSWISNPSDCRSAYRNHLGPRFAGDSFGFRCARTP